MGLACYCGRITHTLGKSMGLHVSPQHRERQTLVVSLGRAVSPPDSDQGFTAYEMQGMECQHAQKRGCSILVQPSHLSSFPKRLGRSSQDEQVLLENQMKLERR